MTRAANPVATTVTGRNLSLWPDDGSETDGSTIEFNRGHSGESGTRARQDPFISATIIDRGSIFKTAVRSTACQSRSPSWRSSQEVGSLAGESVLLLAIILSVKPRSKRPNQRRQSKPRSRIGLRAKLENYREYLHCEHPVRPDTRHVQSRGWCPRTIVTSVSFAVKPQAVRFTYRFTTHHKLWATNIFDDLHCPAGSGIARSVSLCCADFAATTGKWSANKPINRRGPNGSLAYRSRNYYIIINNLQGKMAERASTYLACDKM